MDTDTSAEKMLQDVHAGREVIYSLLYRSFIMTPDEDYYRMLESLLSNMFPTTKGAEQIEQFLRERISATDKAEYDLETQREYTRLFCMTNSVRTCQSHYESDNKLSREAPYDECLALYAAYEFPVDESHSEDADFIAEQLRFMSYMASLSNEAA